MNGTGETAESKGPCGIAAFIPLGMSCRDRAEAFARRLQTKLRTLGSQETSAVTDELTYLNQSSNSHTQHTYNQTNNDSQRRYQTDSSDTCYDFEIELASPASPTEEYNYRRLFKNVSKPTSTNKNENTVSSPASSHASNSSDSCCSSEVQYFDPESSEGEQRSQSLSIDYYDCVDSRIDVSESAQNGRLYPFIDSDSCSESLPNSQSTTSLSACTQSSSSNYTLRDDSLSDLCYLPKGQYDKDTKDGSDSDLLVNGHLKDFQDLEKYSESIFKRNLELDTPFLLNNKHFTDSPTPETSPECDDLKLKDMQSSSDLNDGKEEKNENSEEDEFRVRPPRLRRCSSLKTGKTPPGTPGRKKIVRFADVLGLDLADVKTFLDEVPTVPMSAYEDLEVADQLDESEPTAYVYNKVLISLFEQPGGRTDFLDIIRNQYVCLENAIVSDVISLTITGSIRVRNLDFNKSVHLRYTLDGWKSFADFQANYIENSCDGFSDKFGFTIFGNSLQIGDKLEMAVRFSCRGQQFWDNNFGANYCFLCMSPSAIEADDSNVAQQKHEPNELITPPNSWEAAFY